MASIQRTTQYITRQAQQIGHAVKKKAGKTGAKAAKASKVALKVLGRAAVAAPVVATAAVGNYAFPLALALRFVLPDDSALVKACWTGRSKWGKRAIAVDLFATATILPLYLGMSPYFIISTVSAVAGLATAQMMIDHNKNMQFNLKEADPKKLDSKQVKGLLNRAGTAIAATFSPLAFAVGFTAPLCLKNSEVKAYKKAAERKVKAIHKSSTWKKAALVGGTGAAIGTAAYLNSALTAMFIAGGLVIAAGAQAGSELANSTPLKV